MNNERTPTCGENDVLPVERRIAERRVEQFESWHTGMPLPAAPPVLQTSGEAQEEAERAAFDDWIKRDSFNIRQYTMAEDYAWDAWKVRGSLAAPLPLGVPHDLKNEAFTRVGKCVAAGSARIIVATAITAEWADKIVAALAPLPLPAQQGEPTDPYAEQWLTVRVLAQGDSDGESHNTAAEAVHHGLQLAYDKGLIIAWDEVEQAPSPANIPQAAPGEVQGWRQNAPSNHRTPKEGV